MTSKTKPSFIRLFLGGFALGAIALGGVQIAHAGPEAISIAAQAHTR
jgi:hypothetical protein